MESNPSLSSEPPLPAIRQGIEAIQIEHEGKPMVLLRDQEGINAQAVAVTLPGFLIAMMLNGKNTVSDVQSIFAKTTGALLSPDEVKNMVSQLEKSDMLETEALQRKRQEIWDQFLASPVRKPAHAGGGYPENKLELAALLGSFFQHQKGPGKQPASQPLAPAPLGLFAPHIDFNRGGPAYAWAYQALSETAIPDIIVALGVAHTSPNSPWVFTKKDYETPYGPMKVNEQVFEDLASALWYNPAEDEWTHRQEHSLEFQALWLKYLWREKTPEWVPILCSSFDRFCPDRAPSTIPTMEGALRAMGEKLKVWQKAGRNVLILAGVDLAHVGPRFGDDIELNAELEKKVEAEDRVSLAAALKLDADGFYTSVIANGHWRKVCGLSAVYTAARLIKTLSADPSKEGTLLTYGQAPDPLGGIVSFTSALFPR